MTYKIEELRMLDGSEAEANRTRKIFEDLKTKALADEQLTEHEKDFFCLGVKLSKWNDGVLTDYRCCDNYIFKTLYLVYFTDLTGGSVYHKATSQVSAAEARLDLDYLIQQAKEWDIVINKANHSEQLLKDAAKEAREDINRGLDKLPEFVNDPYAKGKFRYKYKRWAHLLHSKYTYHIAQEIYETFGNKPFILNFAGNVIELNEYSLIHILSRHFAQITKKYETGKTYHKEDFSFRLLGTQLQQIFDQINAHTIAPSLDFHKIIFQSQRQLYSAWVNERTKQVKGQGNVNYFRLETLYPIGDPDELAKISTDYSETVINEAVGIFTKN